MAGWSAAEILAVWERGAEQDWPRRGLTMLAAWPPPEKGADHGTLTIGERDAWLFQLRARLFGDRMACYADCPTCAAPLQFEIDARQFSQRPARSGAPFELIQADRFRVRFRPLNSDDLTAAGGAGEVAAMRRKLLERAILEAVVDGCPASVADLPEEAIDEIGRQLARRDGAELLLDLHCAACGHEWQETFDILSFFWNELSRYAKRLLQEVHTLAWAYGWSESEILSMSTARRRVYLEWVQ
jgi:hypothetical protein